MSESEIHRWLHWRWWTALRLSTLPLQRFVRAHGVARVMIKAPDSPLKAQMDYYIEPAEQTPEVQAQLDAITPASLDPEALTLMPHRSWHVGRCLDG